MGATVANTAAVHQGSSSRNPQAGRLALAGLGY